MKAFLHSKTKPTDKHWYAYDVVFEGENIITGSRDPEHDLARALLSRGITGRVTMHDGAAVRGHSPEAIMVLPTMPMDDDTAAA